MQPQPPGAPGATPERLPSYLLASSQSAAPPAVPAAQASPALPPSGQLFRGTATPPSAIAFNERLRPGGGTASPAPRAAAASTPGRMPPSRSLMDAGAPTIFSVRSPAVATPATATAAALGTPRAAARGAERWITVFGFPPSLESAVLREFRRHGEVVRTVAGRGNWMHLMYATVVQAQVALHKQWRLVASGAVMVGIVPCTEPELAREAEDQVERGIMVASPSATAAQHSPMMTTPSPAHRTLRTPSSILRREPVAAGTGTPSAIIRTPQPQKGIFGYIADLYG